ncbi:MAG: hypothetical protein ACRDL6_12095 [Solirubrobacterales bacterium]
MDFSRLRNGEVLAALGGIALFVFLFFDWYGGGEAFGEGGISGWDALATDVTGFVVALTAVAGVALALLAAADRRVNAPLPRGCGTAALGALSVAIILWRMLANDGLDLKIGIFLGLLAALAIAAGAVIALREDGFEPLVAATGRARASSGGGTATRRAITRTSGARKTTARSSTRKSTGTRRATGTRKSSSRSGGSRARSSTGKRRSTRK